VVTAVFKTAEDHGIRLSTNPETNDQVIARAVNESYETYTGVKAHGAGLLTKRVPEIIFAWANEEEVAS
jgi:hypothetical protein